MNIWDKKKCIKSKERLNLILVTYKDGFNMFVYSGKDFVSNSIQHSGIWKECESLYKIWEQFSLYNVDGYFVDVGANIGTCSLKMLNKGIKTISFEPVKDNLNLFTKSLLYNKNMLPKIKLYTVGLSNISQKLPIYINKDMGGSSFYGNWSVNLKGKSYSQLYTLDEIYRSKLNISLLKIDVEGYEYNVLQGAKNLLESHRIKVVFLEINCYGLSSVGLNEKYVYNILKEYKYNLSTTVKCKGYDLFDLYAIANDYKY